MFVCFEILLISFFFFYQSPFDYLLKTVYGTSHNTAINRPMDHTGET